MLVHRDPAPNGYGSIVEHGVDAVLSPLALPDLKIRVGEVFGD